MLHTEYASRLSGFSVRTSRESPSVRRHPLVARRAQRVPLLHHVRDDGPQRVARLARGRRGLAADDEDARVVAQVAAQGAVVVVDSHVAHRCGLRFSCLRVPGV